MPFKLSLCAVALTLAASSAYAQAPAETDAEFVTKASIGNMFEVQEAKLALTKATDPNLKGFAKQMIADHGDAQKKLKMAADKAGDKLAMSLDKPHLDMLENLKTFSGSDFDKIYKADQIAAHDETVNLLSDLQAERQELRPQIMGREVTENRQGSQGDDRHDVNCRPRQAHT